MAEEAIPKFNDWKPNWNQQDEQTKRERLTQARRHAQATRPQIKTRFGSFDQRAEFEIDRKTAGINDPDIKQELLVKDNDREQGIETLGERADQEMKRKAALFVRRLSPRLMDRRGLDPSQARTGVQAPFTSPEAQAAKRQVDSQIPESNQPRGTQDVDPITESKLRSMISNIQMRQQQARSPGAQDELERLKQEQIDRLRKAVKRKLEAAAKRGIIYIVDLLAGCLDLGTAGISTLVDILFYIFTFGWLNLEMFYGTHLRKGKDLLISPLSWDPIPMPVDPDAIILQGLLVAADITLIILIFGISIIGLCAGYDFVQFYTNPADFVAGLVANGAGEACMGGIIKATMGL